MKGKDKMKKILSVFCTIVIVCAIFGGCTTSSEETAVTNNDLYNYDCVVRIVALSGGYDVDEACELLSENNKMIASFSRALLQDLNAHQTQEEFDTALNNAIVKIYNASID